MLQIGSLVEGKYRIVSKCGQGGMSVVYMARNERANKTWAIKEVRKDGIQDFEVVKQGLIAEIDLLKKLDHPNLPSIVDVLDGAGTFLIVMDFIEGRTLQEVLEEEGAQPQEKVLGWARQLCAVLDYLHTREPAIIYRDMKPSNIMLKPDGQVVLFDFGTAQEYKMDRLEDTTCLGTVGYAAPEQYGGQGQTDSRTDIYCLGATLYHLLTGHNPSEPPYEMKPIRQWDPALSAGLEAVLLKCIQNDPVDRYQSCAELGYALEHYWEADAKYRRIQKKKLCGFLISVLLTFFMGVGSFLFYEARQYLMVNNYDAYLAAARNSTKKEEELENYRRAIRLDPSRGEGYRLLLQEGFLDDDVLSEEESQLLRSILIAYDSGNQTNETIFRKNEKEYAEFAYEAGVAYYYKFEDHSNKKNAKGYFEVASKSPYLEEKQVERAKRLYVISDYYSRVGVADRTGDAMITYRKYWDDLIMLSVGNLVEVDNERTALIMYKETVLQIISHAVDFKQDGVSKEEMEAQLVNIQAHLQTDFKDIHKTNQELIREEIEQLEEEIVQAERMLQSAFGQTEQEG